MGTYFGHLSPKKAYVISLVLSAVFMFVICVAVYSLYNTPLTAPKADYFKDYASGYAAILTLLIGVPIAFASSIAVVLLAMASVEATREQPRIDQIKETTKTIKEIHDGLSSLVDALNTVDDHVAELTRIISNFLGKGRDPHEGGYDAACIKLHLTKLRQAVLVACDAADVAFRNPMVRAFVKYRLQSIPLNVSAALPEVAKPDRFAEVAKPDRFATLLAFSGRERIGRASRCRTEIADRLLSLYVEEIDISGDAGEDFAFALKNGSTLAVAGLALWEQRETWGSKSPEGTYGDPEDDTELRVLIEPRSFPAAAYLADLINIIPDAKAVADFMIDHNTRFELAWDKGPIFASAELYDVSQGLQPDLRRAAENFPSDIMQFATVVPRR